MNNLNGQWILLVVIIIAIVFFALNGRKKRWYTIYLTNGDMMKVYRQMWDWWFYDSSGMMAFRLPDGRHIKVAKYGIIKIEQERDTGK